jgi:CheY-like chemotaxis protein
MKKDKPVILIVDDQLENIEFLEAYLTPQGYDIVTAANGEEALGKLSGNKIDLILLDILMPVMNGFMVIRELRNDVELRKIKVIAVTSFAMKGDREKALQAGFDEYVTKPIDTRTFPELVKQVLTQVQP